MELYHHLSLQRPTYKRSNLNGNGLENVEFVPITDGITTLENQTIEQHPLYKNLDYLKEDYHLVNECTGNIFSSPCIGKYLYTLTQLLFPQKKPFHQLIILDYDRL